MFDFLFIFSLPTTLFEYVYIVYASDIGLTQISFMSASDNTNVYLMKAASFTYYHFNRFS